MAGVEQRWVGRGVGVSSAYRLHGQPPLYLTVGLLDATPGLTHGWSTRHVGPLVSTPSARRRPFPDTREGLFFARVGINPADVAYPRQVHSADFRVVDDPPGAMGPVGNGDILLTRRRGVGLGIFTADCLGMVLYDPVRGVVAVTHAGWRGTVLGVAAKSVQAMAKAFGTRPEEILVGIGPSIGPCCYEVDRPVVDPLSRAHPGWEAWVTSISDERWRLDLWRANEDQLQWAGVRPEWIANPRLCTSCRVDLFFSYRAERGLTGRLLTVAQLR